MTAAASLYGRLGGDPVQRTSQSGTPWATASIAVQLSDDESAGATWFGLVAFGKVAEVLARHTKGDLIAASGRLKLNRYRDRDGNDREQLQLIADTVISARTVRPGGGRKRSDGGGPC